MSLLNETEACRSKPSYLKTQQFTFSMQLTYVHK
jgi:hypothetical protein